MRKWLIIMLGMLLGIALGTSAFGQRLEIATTPGTTARIDSADPDDLIGFRFPDEVVWKSGDQRKSARFYEIPDFQRAWLVKQRIMAFEKPDPVLNEDRTLGTKFTWATSKAAAIEQAKKEDKLVMVFHLSGNMEQPGFT